jgi:flavin reductase (DIM6/NTAB) family NADH-FMN oxidoreductase RutF
MNVCAVDFPPGVSEVEAAGLTLAPSLDIAVPRIAEAPFALECRRHVSLAFGPERELLIGEVLRLHARPGLVDADRMRIDPELYRPVGRLFGDDFTRQGDRFAMRKLSYQEWGAGGSPSLRGRGAEPGAHKR